MNSGCRSLLGRALAAVLVTAAALGRAAPAGAIEPDALPSTLWWRAAEVRGLAADPLITLRSPGSFHVDAEWAPLYSGADGARIEREHRTLRLATPPGDWRGAVELGVRGAIARGASEPAWIGAEDPSSATSTIAIARRAGRFDVAGAASSHDQRTGLALGGEARLGVVRWSLGWSLLPQQGRTDVRWNDVDVSAQGRWLDQRVGWELAFATPGHGEIAIGQDALDRRPQAARDESIDCIQPEMAWRASHLRAARPAFGLGWRLGVEYGEGRETIRICRSGTPYATIQGPIRNGLATLEAVIPGPGLAVRVWTGRWSGDARAALALWPFDGLAAVAGTRRIAHSSAALAHRGIALERTPPAGSGVDGGLALWSLAPRAHYQSWQATVSGVGRDDVSDGETGLSSALAIGARLAGTFQWRGARARLELVQWIPVHATRLADAGGGSSGGGDDGGGSVGSSGGERGGTIVRLSLDGGR